MKTENSNFRRKLKESGLSGYAVSRQSGVPYTTISRLTRCVTDINDASCETVFKLAALFGCSVEELMNPVQLMAGVSGKYRGIRYRWEPSEDGQAVSLVISDGGKEVTLEETADFIQPRFKSSYMVAAQAYIDLYLEKQEAEKEIEKLYLNAQR